MANGIEIDLTTKALKVVEPTKQDRFDELYHNWKTVLQVQLKKVNENSSLPQDISI